MAPAHIALPPATEKSLTLAVLGSVRSQIPSMKFPTPNCCGKHHWPVWEKPHSRVWPKLNGRNGPTAFFNLSQRLGQHRHDMPLSGVRRAASIVGQVQGEAMSNPRSRSSTMLRLRTNNRTQANSAFRGLRASSWSDTRIPSRGSQKCIAIKVDAADRGALSPPPSSR